MQYSGVDSAQIDFPTEDVSAQLEQQQQRNINVISGLEFGESGGTAPTAATPDKAAKPMRSLAAPVINPAAPQTFSIATPAETPNQSKGMFQSNT